MSHTLDSKGAYTQAATSDAAPCMDDDPLIDSLLIDSPLISQDALESVIRREFKTIPTLWPTILLCLVHVAYVALSVTVIALCVFDTDDGPGRQACADALRPVSAGSAVVYGKACLWVLVLFFNVCVQHHHSKARRRGYLSFYRHTQGLNHLPFTIHSAGNVALLIVVDAELSHRLSDEWFGIMLLIILVVELVLVVPCLIYYMVRVVRFNRERAVPDVSREEHSHTHSSTNLTMETGFREGSNLEEVVEKQADLIEYLKQHNTQLSRRLLNLTAQH